MFFPKGDGSSKTGKLILSWKRRSFPLEILLTGVCGTDWLCISNQVCIKICEKPPRCFFISYNCFYIVRRYHFSQLFRTSSFNIILKKFFVTNFPFFYNGITETNLPPLTQQQPKSTKYDEFFCWCLLNV